MKKKNKVVTFIVTFIEVQSTTHYLKKEHVTFTLLKLFKSNEIRSNY